MRKSRFSEEKIVAILQEYAGGGMHALTLAEASEW
jgi:hypothetical protein